jgi:hypothetical protein
MSAKLALGCQYDTGRCPMTSGIAVHARLPYGGPAGVIARYDTTPGRIWSIQIPALPPAGSPPDTGPAVIVSVQATSDGLPHEEMAVINSLGAIMAQPGAKTIRLNVVRADGTSAGVLGDGRLALHVHLLETTSQLCDDGEPTTYTVQVSDGPACEPSTPRVAKLNVRLRPTMALPDEADPLKSAF